MWQISSGYPPFKSEESYINLILAIQGGEREKIIEYTPIEYSDLYTSKLILSIIMYYICTFLNN